MNCNTWGILSLIASVGLAYVAFNDIGISQEIAGGASAGMLVAAIVFFVVRKVSPLIPKEHH